MAAISTKQKLLTLIDDIEIVSKELFDVMSTPKNQQKTDAPDPALLMELLVQKDKEMKESLKLAEEQMDIQKIMDELKMEVEKRDTDIRNLQKNFKEAETILATAIYQAKQKLNSIAQANKKTISSEELIKFAHRISASNAIAAPVTWAPGTVLVSYSFLHVYMLLLLTFFYSISKAYHKGNTSPNSSFLRVCEGPIHYCEKCILASLGVPELYF
ncbi:mediator of RNA polymerase II transcription subunit 4 isoform X2 [Octopus sinensis]|uniref:Mediator of RNA polymerase II transcription subunit 4 n=1 Tax=Octopus sinensis TaxID=2607531 RepID=A0A7E6FJC6_9MOLL|nr:mediator of RNA polymerase II transcription subunit 4 isoform X2 [Octopus sinensis]